MKCSICKKSIDTTFLSKIIGTYIKDKNLKLGGEREEWSVRTAPEWGRLQDPIRLEQVIGEVSSDMIGSVADASRVRGRREEQEPGVLDGAGGQDKDAPGDGKLVPGQRLHRDAADPRGARRDVEPGHAAVKEHLQSRLLQFVTVRET